MDSEQWIQSLARQARRETTPELRVIVPQVAPATYRLPRSLSLSAGASLAAACLLMVMGLNAQGTSTSSASETATKSVQTPDAVTVLFSPLDAEGY